MKTIKTIKLATIVVIWTLVSGCASTTGEKQINLISKSGSTEEIENAKAEAKKLMSSMNLETALEQSMEQMIQIQLQQNPTMQPYKKVMMAFISKHMSYKSLEPHLIQIYAEAFSVQELRDINAFYQTPTGRKTIKIMPELMAKGAQIGVSRVQENAAELQQMLKEESERLQKQQGK